MSAATPPSASNASSSPRRRASRSNCWRKEVFMGRRKRWRTDRGERRRDTARGGASRASLTLVVAGVAAAAAQEEASDGLGEPAALVAFGRIELGERAVEELLGQAARERLEDRVDVLAGRQQLPRPRDLESAPVVGLRVERLDQRHRAAPVEPLDEALHTGFDDRLGLG